MANPSFLLITDLKLKIDPASLHPWGIEMQMCSAFAFADSPDLLTSWWARGSICDACNYLIAKKKNYECRIWGILSIYTPWSWDTNLNVPYYLRPWLKSIRLIKSTWIFLMKFKMKLGTVVYNKIVRVFWKVTEILPEFPFTNWKVALWQIMQKLDFRILNSN